MSSYRYLAALDTQKCVLIILCYLTPVAFACLYITSYKHSSSCPVSYNTHIQSVVLFLGIPVLYMSVPLARWHEHTSLILTPVRMRFMFPLKQAVTDIVVCVYRDFQGTVALNVKRSTKGMAVMNMLEANLGVDLSGDYYITGLPDYFLMFDGGRVSRHETRTLADLGIEDGETLDLVRNQVGMIGTFVSSRDMVTVGGKGVRVLATSAPGAEWVCVPSLPSPPPPATAVSAMVRAVGNATTVIAAVPLVEEESVITSDVCATLRGVVDKEWKENKSSPTLVNPLEDRFVYLSGRACASQAPCL